MEHGDEIRSHLDNLVELEIFCEKALFPELEYTFKHALTQEVAYESLLKQKRNEIHGRIAQTIEELYTEKLEEHYELIVSEVAHQNPRSLHTSTTKLGFKIIGSYQTDGKTWYLILQDLREM